MKKELTELRFNENDIQLSDNLVRGSILPERAADLGRVITVQRNSIIEGAVFAQRLDIRGGDTEFHGAVFVQGELYVADDAAGDVTFKKSVGAADSIVSRAVGVRPIFGADINARRVTLSNAFVAGSIYADEIVLKNCVVIGGVFATQDLDLANCVIGTFNAPSVQAAQSVWLLLPSAFSIERVNSIPGTSFYNLALADLGALYKGTAQSPDSGKIEMDLAADEVKTTLIDGETQKTLRSYTVVGKVLAADMLDMDKFQNHFLLTAASLGSQLLKNYDLGVNEHGKDNPLTLPRIRDFFFDILSGKTEVQTLTSTIDISKVMNG